MPKIFSGWKSVNWRTPKLWEKELPAQTLLELSTASLIPDDIRGMLHQQFGDNFNKLDDFEQLIVTTAAVEGWVNHERACQLTTKHSREVTLTLPKLEHKGFLISNGEQKQKSYTLPGASLPTPDEVFATSSTFNALSPIENSTHNTENLTHNTESLTYNEGDSTYNRIRDEQGRFISEHLDRPFIDDIEQLESNFKLSLVKIAQPAIEKKRLAPEAMRTIILTLCKDQYIAIGELAKLVGRTNQNIRQSHLKPLVTEGLLRMAFPQSPNTPRQGYTVNDSH